MDRLNESAEEIKNLFRNIHKNFRHYILAQMSHRGLNFTVPQLMVMQELYGHPAITLKELSELMGLANSTVCGIVDRLETQGAVLRTRDTEDRRTVKISLAPKMLDFKDTINIIKKNYLTGLFKNIEPSEVEKIICGLRILNSLTTDHTKGE